jgi:hypothetical protein
MITRKSFFVFLLLAVIIWLPSSDITGQSGRVLPIAKSPEAMPDRTKDKGQDKTQSLATDTKPNRFRILFASDYEGKLTFLMSEVIERKRSRMSKYNSLLEQLNLAGREGFRLISSIDGDLAVVELEEGHYEYRWFETISSVHFAKNGLRGKLKDIWEEGFRLVDHSLISKYCELTDYEFSTNYEVCEYIDFFMSVKENGEKTQIQQNTLSTLPGWGSRPSSDLANEITESLLQGFYPIRAISKFELLLERDINEIPEEKPDVQVVRSGWGTNNLHRRVNELARNGYRLAVTTNGITVLYRNKETANSPVSYVWLRADRRNFERELNKLQKAGARFVTTYPNEKGMKNTLVFEQNLDKLGRKAEFRVLTFEFDVIENRSEGKVYRDLTATSKLAVRKMNELAEEGFLVRDLFDSGKISLIMERMR